jgi:hypothetical protein
MGEIIHEKHTMALSITVLALEKMKKPVEE